MMLDFTGLKDGDHLVTVNSLAVSQLSHEQVVRVIGSSSGTLKLQINEASRNQGLQHDTDSSDNEQYVKPRYTNSQTYLMMVKYGESQH